MNSLSDRRAEISPRMVSNGSPRGGGGRERSRSAEGSRHRARSFSRSRSRERVVVGDSGVDSRGGGRRSSYRRSYRSRSRSRDSYNDYDRHYYKSHRSPMSRGRRYMGNSRVSPPYAAPDRNHRYSSHRNDMSRGSSRFMQENPGPNKCLGVFGLSLRTTERDLREVFSRYGPIEECTVVIDAQTGRSRGFAFIYFETLEDSKAAKESCNGIEIDGRRIRVDFSITQRAHTPTPGIYMGKPTYNSRRRDDYRGSYRRSPSPYSSSRRGSRRGHSRSRSYSPRRY